MSERYVVELVHIKDKFTYIVQGKLGRFTKEEAEHAACSFDPSMWDITIIEKSHV